MAGGLFDPLGTDRRSDRPADGPTATLPTPLVVAGLALAAMAALTAVAYLRDDGDRGRPTAISTIDHVASPRNATVAAPSPGAAAPAASAAMSGLTPLRDDQEVEVQNGVRIIRPRRASPEGQGIKAPPSAMPSNSTTGR